LLLFFQVKAQQPLETFKDANGKYGLKNKSGEIVTQPKYEYIGPSYEGYAIIRLIYWGFIDIAGKEITPIKYQEVRYFKEGLAGVKSNNKWGIIDKTGKEVVTIIYQAIDDFSSEGLAAVYLNDKWGFIDWIFYTKLSHYFHAK